MDALYNSSFDKKENMPIAARFSWIPFDGPKYSFLIVSSLLLFLDLFLFAESGSLLATGVFAFGVFSNGVFI